MLARTFAVIVLALTLQAQPTPAIERAIAFTPEVIGWGEGPASMPAGTEMAILEGDPREDGMFTIRLRVPAGAALPPHWHPRQERVTVLSGAVELGFGSTANPALVARYKAGSFYVNPPRSMHYVFFHDATELQITGVGPWEIHTTDSDSQPGQETTATVTVRGLTPPAGSELTASTELVANVEYEIRNFRPATFYLSMQFESTTPNQSFSSKGIIISKEGQPTAPPLPKMLTAASGKATVEQGMEAILRSPMLKRPIRLRIFVHEQTSESTSRVAGSSDWIEFR